MPTLKRKLLTIFKGRKRVLRTQNHLRLIFSGWSEKASWKEEEVESSLKARNSNGGGYFLGKEHEPWYKYTKVKSMSGHNLLALTIVLGTKKIKKRRLKRQIENGGRLKENHGDRWRPDEDTQTQLATARHTGFWAGQ